MHSCKRPPVFPALSEILVILSLLAPLTACAAAAAWAHPLRDTSVFLPVTLSAYPVKASLSFSVPVYDAANGVGDLRDEQSCFCWNGRPRLRPGASTAVVSRFFKRVHTSVRRHSLANVTGFCALFPSQRGTFNRPYYIPLYYRKTDQSSKTSCQPFQSYPLPRTVLRSRTFFSAPGGHLSSVRAVGGGSHSSPYLFNLCALRSDVCVARGSRSGALTPATNSSCFPCWPSGSARDCLPDVSRLFWGTVYRRYVPRFPRAFGTPRGKSVACSATTESRAQALLEDIKKLTIVEVTELVNLIEQSFGVPAVRVAAADLGNKSQEDETEKDEGVQQAKAQNKTAFSVEIKAVPLEKRIVVIKTLRTVRPDLGLKDAKGVIDALPNTILSNISKEKAEEAQKILVDAGAQVEIK